ncbi:MAG: hypothetical protein ACI35P_14765 [Bacillus sp. (in: firmicutes)]
MHRHTDSPPYIHYTNAYNHLPEQPLQVEQHYRQVVLPEVEPTEFVNSSRLVLDLLQDAQVLSQNLLQTEFAKQIMDAGQKSRTDLIHQLIRTLPIKKSDIHVSYTPYGVDFTFRPIIQGAAPTAIVTLHLTWKRLI